MNGETEPVILYFLLFLAATGATGILAYRDSWSVQNNPVKAGCAVLICVALFLLSTRSCATDAQLCKVGAGMTESEVLSIMGTPYHKDAPRTDQYYYWTWSNWEEPASPIVVGFNADRHVAITYVQ